MKKTLIILTILSVTFFSCGKLDRKYPVRNFYTLDISNLENSTGQGQYNLKLTRVRMNPEYYLQEFNYKIGPNEFINDFYNQFYKSVDLVISAELYKWLSNSGIFKQVLASNSVIEAKYFMYGNIVDMYADFTGSPKVILNMQFFLVDESGNLPVLVYTNVYEQEMNLSDTLPNTLVDGWSQELKNIFTDLENDLSTLPQLQY